MVMKDVVSVYVVDDVAISVEMEGCMKRHIINDWIMIFLLTFTV